MKEGKKIAKIVLATVVTANLLNVAAPAIAATKYVKCYGVAAAGKNDCGTVVSSCAATVNAPGACYAWVYTPKGLCAKIVNSSVGKPAVECKGPSGQPAK